MECNYCGNQIHEKVKHCPHCGAQILDYDDFKTDATPNEQNTNFETPRSVQKQNNGMKFGITALIFSFISPIVSIILATFGINEAKKADKIDGIDDTKLSLTFNIIAIVVSIVQIIYSIVQTVVIFYEVL